MSRVPPAMRAKLDRELAETIEVLKSAASEYDGTDIIEANVELSMDLAGRFNAVQLAAATAMLALRLHRQGSTDG